MKKLIKEYLKLCISNKKSLKKEISDLNMVTEQLYEITSGLYLLVEELTKESYKIKFQNEHKKRKELEKESREIIQELTDTIKDLEKGKLK